MKLGLPEATHGDKSLWRHFRQAIEVHNINIDAR